MIRKRKVQSLLWAIFGLRALSCPEICLSFFVPHQAGKPCWSKGRASFDNQFFLEAIHSRELDSVTGEISPYYRCDRRFSGTFEIKNVTGLASLLENRFLARQLQRKGNQGNQHEIISSIDRELRQRHKVRVSDRPPIWAPYDSEPPLSFHRRKREWIERRLEDRFGLTGHPYQRVGGPCTSILDCPLSESEIHQRLRLIAECRYLKGEHEKAQVLEFELSLLGVRLSDTLEWTDSPNLEFSKKEEKVMRTRNIPAQGNDRIALEDPSNCDIMRNVSIYYNPMGNNTESCADLVRIEQLLALRSKAIATGSAEEAEFLSLELFQTYRVGVCEILKTWFFYCDSSFNATDAHALFWKPPGKPSIELLEKRNSDREKTRLLRPPLVFENEQSNLQSPPYAISSMSQKVDPCFRQRVLELVQHRIHKREEGKFLEADAIRKELWCTYNVGLNDRLRQYSVDGQFCKKN
mmetsp:Transcript_926/g.1220  ORF Transcript_926/g.1220 Transcript_926/m.1220 type:complete len:465 (+) Transcript_926:114-1508(+)